jgi:hypothetical protein
MSSDITYRGQSIWVSNQRLGTLVAFAVEVGSDIAHAQEEIVFVQRQREEESTGLLFPGCSFDLNERFPTVAAKTFWAGVFYEIAQRIFLRRLGNHDIETWQASAICDAQSVGRMLTEAVRGPDATGFTSR